MNLKNKFKKLTSAVLTLAMGAGFASNFMQVAKNTNVLAADGSAHTQDIYSVNDGISAETNFVIERNASAETQWYTIDGTVAYCLDHGAQSGGGSNAPLTVYEVFTSADALAGNTYSQAISSSSIYGTLNYTHTFTLRDMAIYSYIIQNGGHDGIARAVTQLAIWLSASEYSNINSRIQSDVNKAGVYGDQARALYEAAVAYADAGGKPLLNVKVYSSGNAWYQTFMMATYEKVTGSFELQKSNSCPELTAGNSQYSLAGAVYALRDAAGATVATLTTDANGYAKVDNIPVGTYTLVEVTAPKGFELSTEVKTVTVGNGETTHADVSDKPMNDPLVIELNKIQENGNVENPYSMEGAEFTVKYYDAQYATVADLPAQPTRTWVLKTIKSKSGKYLVMLNNKYFVSGDEFYKDQLGLITLPLGTITVEETKAPEGYTLKNKTLDVNGNELATVDNGVALMNIVDVNGIGKVNAGNVYTIAENAQRGSLELQKKDLNNDNATPQGDATLGVATYEIINDNEYGVQALAADGTSLGVAQNKGDVVTTIQTDATGHFKSSDNFLSYGNYIIKEVGAPTGYQIKGVTESNFSITHDGASIELTSLSDSVQVGGFKLVKWDSDTLSTRAQGEAVLGNAKYELVNASVNPVWVNGVKYGVGEKIMEFETDANGNYESEKNLPYGTYTINEIAAPVGYKLSGTISSTFSIRNHEEVVSQEGAIKNDVITGKLKLHKTFNETNSSDFVKNEENAKFGVVLKKYVTQYGSVKEALKHTSEFTDKEWDVITTDANGEATTRDLAYGHYVVAQIDSDPALEAVMITNTAEFVVDTENQPVKTFEASNLSKEYRVRLLKTDKETGKSVTFNSASFKIKNEDGEYVTMRVGKKKYDTFKTTSENLGQPAGTVWADAEDDNGSVVTPLTLLPGKYTLEEVETPWGFVKGQDLEFTVGKGFIDDGSHDIDGEPVVNVEFANQRAYGKLTVTKTVAQHEANEALFNGDFSGVKFALIAKEDIINPVDGSVITKSGETYKEFNVDATGHAVVENIPVGKYELKEIEAPSNLIMSTETYDVDLSQKNQEDVVIEHATEVVNEVTEVRISKVDGDNQNALLVGAKLNVVDENGKVYSEFVSTGDSSYVITGLPAGHDYQVVEVEAPEGYTPLTEGVHFEAKDSNPVNVEVVNRKPKVHTTATLSYDDNKIVPEYTIIDRVFYEDFRIGVEKTVTGKLVDQVTGEPVLDENGVQYQSTVTFTPTVKDGFVDVKITIPAHAVKNTPHVVYEEVTEEGRAYAMHADINDEHQTVYYPRVGTSASDSTSVFDKASGLARINDVVDVSNAKDGKYVVEGVVMDKSTGKELLDENGNKITGSMTFEVVNHVAKPTVTFIVSGKVVEGKDVVIFESLYRIEPDGSRVYVGGHKDIEDKGQTVHFEAVKTGVSTNTPWMLAMAMTSILAGALVAVKKKVSSN